jgi:hypothetical protein
MSVDPGPTCWTIKREIARAGLAKLRVRPRAHQPKGVHYPAVAPPSQERSTRPTCSGPNTFGGVEFGFNLIDVGSHEAAGKILPGPRPSLVAAGLVRNWERPWWPSSTTTPTSAAAFPPASACFSPAVADCLDSWARLPDPRGATPYRRPLITSVYLRDRTYGGMY